MLAQRFDSAGAATGSEFQVHVYTTANQWSPAVACDATPACVVVWDGSGSGDSFGVFGRRLP